MSEIKLNEKLLGQNDVAEILGISPKTLEYWRWVGKGPRFIKIGRLVRYPESYVQEFVQYVSQGGIV